MFTRSTFPLSGLRFIRLAHLEVSISPMVRLDTDTAVLICILDRRWPHNFQKALLGAVEAPLNKGRVVFYISPNMTVSLTDANLQAARALKA